MSKRVKVAVTGAAGQIGYALLFRIAAGEMFGSDTEVDLSLLELEKALPALAGVVMELDDCAFPLLRSVSISADPNAAFKDIDWALLVGSVPRKEGMERGDLLKINGGVFTVQGQALSNNAKPRLQGLGRGKSLQHQCFYRQERLQEHPGKEFLCHDHARREPGADTVGAKSRGAGRPGQECGDLGEPFSHPVSGFL